MEIFLLSFLVVCLAVLGLAVGTICGGRPLVAGCGSVNIDAPAGVACDVCGADHRDVASLAERAQQPIDVKA